MTINLADNTPRVSYAVAQGATQTSFTVSFEFFDAADLNVYVDGTLKTITTHYTVSGGDGSTGTVTMSVTGATGGSTVVITRDIDLKRTTDFPASGSFQIGSLNTELDKLVAIAADLDDKASRALQLTDFDTAVSLVLPDVNTRKGKTLAFNASTGAVEAGPSTSDVQTVSATAADIATLADIEDGTDATDAIQTVAGIASNVTTVAGVSSNVTTVAGQTTNMQNITDNLSAVQNAATNATTATTKASEAATSATNAASSATSAASSATTATTKASEASTSATNAASSASTASGHKDTATTKASEAASSATAAAASASTASTQASNASTSASTASTQATNSATSATASATSATASATSATAAASSATAAASSQTAAASSAAAAATALDSFDDRYLGVKSSNPSVDNDGNALVSGALYFNDSANEMRVYDGANWIAATSAGNVSLILYEYTATSGQTTFSGSDDNSATLSYTVDNLQVVMNGVILDPSDYTATSGTSVVLASGAAVNDLVNIYAFKSFTTADMVSKTNGGTFAGNVTFADTKELRFGDDNDFSFEHNNATGENLLNLTAGPLEMHQAGTNSVLQVHNDGTNHNQVVQVFKGNSQHGHIATDASKMIVSGQDGLDITTSANNGDITLDPDGTGDVIVTSAETSSTANFTVQNTNASGQGAVLRVKAANTNANSKMVFDDGGTESGFVFDGGANVVQHFVNGSERLRVDSSGNVGIGTSSPQRPLVVSDAGTEGFEFQPGSASGQNTLNHYNRSTSSFVNILTNADQHIFGRADGEKMRIDSSGNVGIGTASPSGVLHTAGSGDQTVTLQAGGESKLEMKIDGNSDGCSIRFSDSDAASQGQIRYQHSTDALVMYTNGNNERMRINSSGQLAINNDGTFRSNEKLTVKHSTDTSAMWCTAASGSVNMLSMYRGSGQTFVGSVETTGSATQYVSASDHRLKENVVDLTGAIDRLKTLSPRRFNFIAEPDTTLDGFIAHEVTACPEAVSGTHNAVDDDGNPKYQGLDASKLVPLLTGALQEAISKIETLETKVAALESGE